MRYIERCPNTNKVLGHFANPQTYATECVPDDHPDILDYMARRDHQRDPPTDVRINSTVIKSAWARGVTRLLAKHLEITEAELIVMIKAEAKEPYLGKPGMGGKDAWEMEEDNGR
jgi:hypothetical protein